MTTTTPKDESQYTERIIQRDDYRPEFHYSQTTRNLPNGKTVSRNRPEMWLVHVDNKETIKLSGNPMRKLVSNYMKYGHRNLTSNAKVVSDRSVLNNKVQEYYDNMTANAFKLQEYAGQVTRFTTQKYEGIPHTRIAEVLERRLDAEGIKYDRTFTNQGEYGKYVLDNAYKELGDGVHGAIHFFNRNTGENAMNFAGGGNIAICSNGLVMGDTLAKVRTVHKLEFAEVEKRVENTVGNILSQLDVMPKQLLALKDIQVTTAETNQLLLGMKIEKYLQNAIQNRLHTPSLKTQDGKKDWDGTLFGIYMAMTYIGSNIRMVQKTRNLTVELQTRHVEKLLNVNTLRDAWDQREKELEAQNAPKVTVNP